MKTARETLEIAAWRRTHKDYRSTIDGARFLMTFANGGSCLSPICKLTDAELKKIAGVTT